MRPRQGVAPGEYSDALAGGETCVALVKWQSHANGTLVETPVVYAKIPGYSSSGNSTMRPRGSAGKTRRRLMPGNTIRTRTQRSVIGEACGDDLTSTMTKYRKI